MRLPSLMRLRVGWLILALGLWVASSLEVQAGGPGSVRLQLVGEPPQPHRPIRVEFSGLPGHATDWMTLVRQSARDDSFAQWFYLQGKRSGTVEFAGVPVGIYEVRVFHSWPTGGYVVQGRLQVEVAQTQSPAEAALEIDRDQVALGGRITVQLHPRPGGQSDWVTFVPASTPDSTHGPWAFRGTGRSATFVAGAPGDHEVRLYHDWPRGRYNVVERRRVRVDPSAQPQVPSVDGAGPSENAALDRAIAQIRASNLGSSVAKEAAVEALKLAVSFAWNPVFERLILAQLEIPANILVYALLENPLRVLQVAVKEGGYAIGTSIVIPIAADILTDALFDTKAVAGIPSSIRAPLKAMTRAVFVETVFLGQSAIKAGAGDPSALISPVLRRIRDIRDIYSAFNGVVGAMDDGLIATAFGMELSAELAVDFPDARSQQVASSTREELNGRIREIVGARSEAAVKEVYRLGYLALVAQRRGQIDQARRHVSSIRQIADVPKTAGGVLQFGRPGFWWDLLRGDPVKRAAAAMIMATSLNDL